MYEYDLGPCGSCAQAQECLGRLVAGTTFKQLATDFALGPELDSKSDVLYSGFSAMGLLEMLEQMDGAPIKSGEALVKVFRKFTAEILEQSDEKIAADETFLAALTANCEGPLKMRATKAGRTITATICNSPQAADGIQKETVVVERSGINKETQ